MVRRIITFGSDNYSINIHELEYYGHNNIFGSIYKPKNSSDIEELNQISGIRKWNNNRYTTGDLVLVEEEEWNKFCNFKINLQKLNVLKNPDQSIHILYSIFERQTLSFDSKKSLLKLARRECWLTKIKEQELRDYMLNELPF